MIAPRLVNQVVPMSVHHLVDMVAAVHVRATVQLVVLGHQHQADVQVAVQLAPGLVLQVVQAAVREHAQELQLVRAILAANNVSSIAAMAAPIRVTNFVTRLVTTHVMLLAIVHVIIQTVRIITVVDVMELVIIHVEHSANRIVLELVILLVKDQRPDNC